MINRLSKRLELDYSNALVAIFELMLRGGVRAKDLLPVCVRCLKRAESRSTLSKQGECGGLTIAAGGVGHPRLGRVEEKSCRPRDRESCTRLHLTASFRRLSERSVS